MAQIYFEIDTKGYTIRQTYITLYWGNKVHILSGTIKQKWPLLKPIQSVWGAKVEFNAYFLILKILEINFLILEIPFVILENDFLILEKDF